MEQKSDLAKGCKHAVQININEESLGPKHSIQVHIEDPSSTHCYHKIQVSVQDHSGRTYRQTVNITGGTNSDQVMKDARSSKDDVARQNAFEQQNDPAVSLTGNVSQGQWVVSGVLDWDDTLSVPLVLARKPPSWLWLDENNRETGWTGNRDTKPKRDLTKEELLIKAHFDQIMAKAIPSYIEDAYRRGPLLRALARFAIYNFEGGVEWNRYDGFVKEWEGYCKALRK